MRMITGVANPSESLGNRLVVLYDPTMEPVLSPAPDAFGFLLRTRPLRRLTLASFALATASMAALAVSAVLRFRVSNDYSHFVVGFDEVHRADDRFTTALYAMYVCHLAAALCVGAWARRVVVNASAVGARGLNARTAMFGWCVPFLWFRVGFHELTKAVQQVEGEAPSLGRWQVGFAIQTALAAATVLSSSLFRQAGGIDDLINALRLQGVLGIITMGCMVVTLVLASLAMTEVSRAVTYHDGAH